jgi:hypothetical protein
VWLNTFILPPYGCAIAEGKSAFYYTLKPSNCSHSEIFAVKASKLASLTQTEKLVFLARDFLLGRQKKYCGGAEKSTERPGDFSPVLRQNLIGL